ncbi:MAG: hypothetical protein AAB597_01810 [Patescibacteria group bacterium]
MRKFVDVASNLFNAATGVLIAIAFGLLFFASPANAAEDKAATSYVKTIADGAVKNATPTTTRVAYWSNMVGDHLNLEHLAALGANAGGKPWKNLSPGEKKKLQDWILAKATEREGNFMKLISDSVVQSVAVEACEISSEQICKSRVTFKVFSANDLKFIVEVTKTASGFKVDSIIYNETMHLRTAVADALAEALRKGQIQLAAK